MADRSGYIGRAPGDSSVTIARQTNTLTSTQSTFVFNSGYDVGYIDVYINGTKLINATDYQATDGQNVTLTVAGTSGDVIEFVAYKAFNLGTVIAEASDLNVTGSFTINNSAVVESLTAGANISLSGSNGDVTITGLAATDVIVSERILVSGVTTSTGGFVGDLTGNADTATQLETARNIGGVSFNGTADINLPGVNQAGNQNTSGTAGGLSGTPDIVVGSVTGTTGNFSGSVSIGGTLTYEDVTNVDSVGLITARTGIKVLAGGLDLHGQLKEQVNVTAGKLSDNLDINIDNGNIHLFTTQETTTSTPNIVSTAGINTDLAVGDAISVTIVTTAAAAGYSAQLTIDGAAVTENWTGGSAPSDGGSSGVDIYAYTIMKTANATYTVVATQTKTS